MTGISALENLEVYTKKISAVPNAIPAGTSRANSTCSICEKTLASKNNLERHMTKVHGKKVLFLICSSLI